MKRYFILAGATILFILLIFSCRKQFEDEPDIGVINSANKHDNTELRIQSFIERMNDGLKSGGPVTTDSAIWYMEAGLNYTYAIYDSGLVYLSRKTTELSIDLNESQEVDEAELEDTYDKMVDDLEDHYNDISETYKHIFYCDVIDMGISNGVLEVNLVTVIACGYWINQYGSFNSTDYWYSILLMGKCDEYQGQGEGDDAATQLEYKIMHPIIVPCYPYRIYWTDDTTISGVHPGDYPYQNAPRGFRAYYYYGHDFTEPQCCDPDELNFYLGSNGIHYIIDDNEPEELEFHSIEIEGELVWLQEPEYEEVHLLNLTYGVKHQTLTPPTPL